jgi:ComF family protein
MHCAVPLPDGVSDNVSCGRCIRNTPAFDYAYSPLRYEGEVVALVHQLKFGEKITFARSFGEIMVELLQLKISLQNRPDCLLPVPLYKSRLRQRGFNQSIELARVIAKKLAIPIEYEAVRRNRSTTSQTGLDADERRKNIRGAFSVMENLKAKHVLIIDDVMTTGSTVNELAITLKRNGVERVGVLSFARAPMKS